MKWSVSNLPITEKECDSISHARKKLYKYIQEK